MKVAAVALALAYAGTVCCNTEIVKLTPFVALELPLKPSPTWLIREAAFLFWYYITGHTNCAMIHVGLSYQRTQGRVRGRFKYHPSHLMITMTKIATYLFFTTSGLSWRSKSGERSPAKPRTRLRCGYLGQHRYIPVILVPTAFIT